MGLDQPVVSQIVVRQVYGGTRGVQIGVLFGTIVRDLGPKGGLIERNAFDNAHFFTTLGKIESGTDGFVKGKDRGCSGLGRSHWCRGGIADAVAVYDKIKVKVMLQCFYLWCSSIA